MRALENGLNLGTLPIKTLSINTPQDFSKAEKFLKEKLFKKYFEKIEK